MGRITDADMRLFFRRVDATLAASIKGFRSAARPVVRGFLDAPDEKTRAPYREAIIREVYARIERYRAVASQLSDDLWSITTDDIDEVRPAFPYEAADARVRSAAVKLFKDRDIEAYLERLENFIQREVNDARLQEARER